MAEKNGWIKLYRQTLDNPIVMKDADHLAVWIYLILNATHDEYPALFKGKKITLKPGQLITGRKAISNVLGISESKIFRIINCFKSEHQIEQQTSNKNSLISIVNWDLYQSSEQQIESQMNSNRTASEQQVNTNKNERMKECKNVRNKKESKEKNDYQLIADLYNETCVSFPKLRTLSESRKKAIKARLHTYTIDDFKLLFQKAEASDFLKGRNDRNWSATFDWLIKDSSMAKVLEGNFDNSGRTEQVPIYIKKNSFNKFPQQNYDFAELEKKIIANEHHSGEGEDDP